MRCCVCHSWNDFEYLNDVDDDTTRHDTTWLVVMVEGLSVRGVPALTSSIFRLNSVRSSAETRHKRRKRGCVSVYSCTADARDRCRTKHRSINNVGTSSNCSRSRDDFHRSFKCVQAKARAVTIATLTRLTRVSSASAHITSSQTQLMISR